MKKILALALALMLVLSLLSACGNTEAPAPAAEPAAEPAEEPAAEPAEEPAAEPAEEPAAEPAEEPAGEKNALEKILESGELHVALSPDFAPMEFTDISKEGQDTYVGFDVTLAKYIAEQLGVTLVIDAMNFDACQTAVYTGSVFMSISGYSWTEERAENYELSDYYYAGDNETEQVILIRKDDAEKYKTAEDFKGVKVGAQNASLQMMMVTEQLPDAEAVTIGEIGTGVLELQAGNIEALAVATGNAEAIMVSNNDLVVCEWMFDVKAEYEANVIMIMKGETELLDKVNELLGIAYDSGFYGEWYEEAVALSESSNALEVSVD